MDDHDLPYSEAQLATAARALGRKWVDEDGNSPPIDRWSTIEILGHLLDAGIDLRIRENFREYDDVPLLYIERARDSLQQAHNLIVEDHGFDDATAQVLRKVLGQLKLAHRSYLSDHHYE